MGELRRKFEASKNSRSSKSDNFGLYDEGRGSSMLHSSRDDLMQGFSDESADDELENLLRRKLNRNKSRSSLQLESDSDSVYESSFAEFSRSLQTLVARVDSLERSLGSPAALGGGGSGGMRRASPASSSRIAGGPTVVST